MAQGRLLRAIALEHGLDPDTALPEDLLLLRRDKDGCLLAASEVEAAAKRLEYVQRKEQAEEWLAKKNHLLNR